MFKASAFIGLAAALALLSGAALAEQGDFVVLGHRRVGACNPHAGAHTQRPRMELQQYAPVSG